MFSVSDRSCRKRKRCLTLNEALDYLKVLENEDSSELSSDGEVDSKGIGVTIIPPDPDIVTDEENVDDDILNDTNIPMPKDVAGELEIHFNNSGNKSKKSTKKNIVWKKNSAIHKDEPIADKRDILQALSEKLNNHRPIDVFNQMFDEKLFEHIVQESIKYAHQHNRQKFSLSVSMLKRFVGFLLYSGYVSLPQEHLYWSVSDDVMCPLVRNAISRSTYLSIKQNLHLADNSNLDKNDKLSKVRPYVRLLNENFMQHDIYSTNLSIDEQMIPYYGKHSSKMFMKGKPVRFGYKVWCLCSSDGYLYNFEIYTGKSQEKSADLGLGGDVVTRLLKVVKDPSNCFIYFDNFFTSLSLLYELSRLGFYATGTIRDNRLGKSPLLSMKEMKKESRGKYDSVYDDKQGISVVRWNDNSVVTIASNWDSAEPTNFAKRYSRKDKKSVSITQPKVIAHYNENMGGVDLLDNFVAMYRINVKGKKWWWPIFTNFLDVAKVNAWRLYRLTIDPQIPLLDFQRNVAVSLLKTPDEALENKEAIIIPVQKRFGRPSKIQVLAINATKMDKSTHLIEKNPENKRKRCKNCSSQTVTICNKCNVALHAKCFKDFHKNVK